MNSELRPEHIPNFFQIRLTTTCHVEILGHRHKNASKALWSHRRTAMSERNPSLPASSPEDNDSSVRSGRGEIVLYQTEDGRTRVECRFQDDTIWLSQAMMAELFQKDVRTISYHLQSIYNEGELDTEATIRKYWIVRAEGSREVSRQIEHYSLDAVLAVGFRVRSQRGRRARRPRGKGWKSSSRAGQFSRDPAGSAKTSTSE